MMPWLDPDVTDGERADLGLPSIAELRAYVSEVNRQRAAALAVTDGLPPEAEFRRTWRPWTRRELLERREREGAACWREGDELVFVHQADADHVRLTLGLQCQMWRLDSDLWAVGYRLRRIDEAFVSYTFVPDDDFAAAFGSGRIATWRGPAAPELPEPVERLRGELRHYDVPSRHLSAPRAVHVYLSPGWQESSSTLVVQAADGAHRAQLIEPLVLQGRLPPVVCLGVDCLGGMGRAHEYLPGYNSAAFDAHMAFQTDELPAWTAGELGLSPSRERRIVTGQSNGGAFAIAAGLERPDVFGHVLAFSVAGGPPPANLHPAEVRPIGVELVAGALEPFRHTTAAWRDVLDRSGIPVRHRELVAGHDPALWDVAFLAGLQELGAR
jgi:enterochelin esterase-like enzyme